MAVQDRLRRRPPGQLLLAESVAAAAREGLVSYELLGSREAWTDVWTQVAQPCSAVVVLPRSPRSLLAVGSLRADAAERRLARWRQQLKAKFVAAAGARYVAGPELEQALAEEARCAGAGYATTVGFWNGVSDSPAKVAAEAEASAAALPAGSEVSVKLVAIGGDGPALDRLLDACVGRGLTLHIDALQYDSASECQATALRLNETAPGRVGCTLPGRWGRSVGDAAALAAATARVRVVKGEVADAGAAEEPEPSAGFLEVVEALAGSPCHVEVATQDASLAARALDRLQEAGTSCELQVLHGMKSAAAIRAAKRRGVPVRVYVPYGTGRLPYSREALRRRPALALSLARDMQPLPPRRPVGT